MKSKLIEISGWYGTVAIVGAYDLNSFSLIETEDLLYQLLNLTGAIGIVIISFYKRAYQPGVLNLIWSVIAFFAMMNIIFQL